MVFLISAIFLFAILRLEAIQKFDLQSLRNEIDVEDTLFEYNRVPFTHNYESQRKRNNRKSKYAYLYDSFLSNLETIAGIKKNEVHVTGSKNSDKFLRSVFIMADDFEAKSEVLSFYGNITSNNMKFYNPVVEANNVSYYDVYTDFSAMYDSESAMMDIQSNITRINPSNYYQHPDSQYTHHNSSASSQSGYDEDDTYYDRDLHIQYAQMYNDSAPLGGLDEYDPGYSAYDSYYDDAQIPGAEGADPYGGNDPYGPYDPYMDNPYIDMYDGQGRVNRPRKRPANKDASTGAGTGTGTDTGASGSANDNTKNKARQPKFSPGGPNFDPTSATSRSYEELILASYEADIIRFYDEQNTSANQSLLIYGRDILTNISLLTNILDYRLMPGSVVVIGAHGTLSNGKHVIDFTGYYDSSSQLVATTDLLLVLQNILSTTTESTDAHSSMNDALGSTVVDDPFPPLQIHLDSCYAGDVAYQLAEKLYSENILITNSKHQFPSISSLSTLKHLTLINALSSCSAVGSGDKCTMNPYEVFLNNIEVEAAQYATFITSKNPNSKNIQSSRRGRNIMSKRGTSDDNKTIQEAYVFSITPSFYAIRSIKSATNYLNKKVAQFIDFSIAKTWLGEPVVLRRRQFTKREVMNFCGNLFVYLCAIGEPEFVSFLDAHTQSPDDMFIVSLFNYNVLGDYAIHMAVSFGHISIVQIYLELLDSFTQEPSREDEEDMVGFNINLPNGNGITPIYMASQYGFTELIELFLQHGADINRPCHKGTTALFAAAAVGYADVVEYLLSHGADIHAVDNEGTTAFHLACQNNFVDVVRLLLSYSQSQSQSQSDSENSKSRIVDINQPKRNGNTPLHIASIRGYIDVVHLLLQNKHVIVDPRNNNDVTPLIMAAQEGYVDIVKLLLTAGANVNHASLKGTTALFTASAFGHTAVVQTLINHGADAGIATVDGFSPIAIAYQEGYDDIRDMLLKVSSNKMCDERRCYA